MNNRNKKFQDVFGKAIVFLVLILFIITGLYIIRRDYITNKAITASEAWPVTSGEVKSSTIKDSYDGEQTTYYPKITYQYTVTGIYYTCDMRVNVSSSKKDDTKITSILKSFPIGITFKVSYNPSHPQDCVSEFDQRSNFSLVPWVFIGIGVILLILIFKKS